jgi:hypothetical protein
MSQASVVTGSDIFEYQLAVMRSRLKLETLGMKSRIPASRTVGQILREAGVAPARSKKALLAQFEIYLAGRKRE